MFASRWLDLQLWTMRKAEALATRRRGEPGLAAHLATGERGECEALFYLRKMGYTVVAHRWKSVKLSGDVDLIAWNGEWLCFIEVKSRSKRGGITAESAVDKDKQQMLHRMARAYLKTFPDKLRGNISVRFDVLSVYLLAEGVECELYRGAFGW
ncbi:MAG: YraN family protein [Acidobacteriota bacterium]|nr:YraN family protein [Acidobacteriota bacterium]